MRLNYILMIVFIFFLGFSGTLQGKVLQESRESTDITIKDLKREQEKNPSYSSTHTISLLKMSLEDFISSFYWRLDTLLSSSLAKFPTDISKAVNRISRGHGTTGLFRMLALLSVVFSLAFLLENLLYRFFLSHFYLAENGKKLGISGRFLVAVLRAIPSAISLIIFTAASYLFYSLIYAEFFTTICPLYLTILTTILIARSLSTLSTLFFSPQRSSLRLLPVKDDHATRFHQTALTFSWLISIGFMFFSLFRHGGLEQDSQLLVRLILGTTFILMVNLILYRNRLAITQLIKTPENGKSCFWMCEQLAAKWYLMALGYIYFIWLLWVARLILIGPEFGFAFAASLFIVPIFLFLDSLFAVLLNSIVQTPFEEPSLQPKSKESSDMQPVFLSYFQVLLRLLLGLGLGLWLLHLWGRGIVFSQNFKDKGLEVLFIMGVTYVAWQIINTLITGYLTKRAKAEDGSDDDVDSEWGDVPLLDRTQTLLPLMQKSVGVILMVLMILLTLSTLGINIAPLLAGAGVAGIALGFGAQKLVSDVLSGLFCLMDDAFRVGEYIEAGSIKGSVEKITLRNVMLRHHRGMLQIIPYSDLGAITNYMRGGIVVKFNLQFSYDTDVDQIRKIIKRVGATMLNEPEFGKNFIKQVKSQGIREVGDSILTIRVKFTAKPGTHFLIRREAYRRITEALAAKGIYYAHRKVIVEVAATNTKNETLERDIEIAGAGAAAHISASNGNIHEKIMP